jgi:putative CocE/NonD family hydrolase
MGVVVRILVLLGSLVLCAGCVRAVPSSPPRTARAEPPGPCAVAKTSNVDVPMRDGTKLKADVYRPRTAAPVPVILHRTQYGKEDAQTSEDRFAKPEWFASHCYLVVSEDIRGQGASGGQFAEYAHDQADGYDSVEWAAGLPGSTGRVGMYGSSYVGATQWLAAEARPPHLATIVPTNTASDYFDGWTYENGAFRLNFIEPWATGIAGTAALDRGDRATADRLKNELHRMSLNMAQRPYDRFAPLEPASPLTAPYFFDWVRHPTNGPYWKRWAPNQHYPQIDLPVLDFEGWYDAFLRGGLENFTGMSQQAPSPFARNNQHVVIGPWDHLSWGRPGSKPAPMLKKLGPNANSPINSMMLAWWDHFLKGRDNGVDRTAKVNYYEMGADKWRSANAWPIPGTRWAQYALGSGGQANGVFGDGTLRPGPPQPSPPDHYTYDPANPVPSAGGHSCCSASTGSQGPYDQQSVEQRPDVLVFNGPKFTSSTEVTGPMKVTLYAATDAANTDWTAKVVAVHPDGSAVNLDNGIARASYRDSQEHPSPVPPGQVRRCTIDVWPTSTEFKPGDQLRLEISSSDYPQFDPNPNTGSTAATTARQVAAHQTVLHDPQHPSTLTLPVVPAGSGGTAPAFPAPPR